MIPELLPLAKALHEAKKVGGPWSPCLTRNDEGDLVQVGFGEDPNGDFACLCYEMASDIIQNYQEVPDATA